MKIIFKKGIVLGLTTLFYSAAFSQMMKVHGVVLDHATHMPLANVTIQCGKHGSISIMKGEFSFFADRRDLNTKGLLCSCIGYTSTRFEISKSSSLTSLILFLRDSVATLPYVTVFDNSNAILRKAITSIEINYPETLLLTDGMERLQETLSNGYYYQNDALVKLLIFPYIAHNRPSQIQLVSNRLYTKTQASKVPPPYYWERGGYRAPVVSDLVHIRPPFLNLKHINNYIYTRPVKISYYGDSVYLIKFREKSGRKDSASEYREGELYIHPDNYAFMAINLREYNIASVDFVPIKKREIKVSYSRTDSKWFLEQVSMRTDFASFNGITGYNIADFHTLGIDSGNVRPLDYRDIIQQRDVIQKLNKPTDTNSAYKYDSLFGHAEKLRWIHAYDTNIPRPRLNKKPFMASIKQYVIGGFAAGLEIVDLPIKEDRKTLPLSTKLAFGLSINFKVVKQLYASFQQYSNFGIGGTSSNGSWGLLISWLSSPLTKQGRPLRFCPFTGYSRILLRSANNPPNILQYLTVGTGFRFELSHKIDALCSGSYMINISKSQSSIIHISPSACSVSTGIIYKY